MANLAAADITVTLLNRRTTDSGRKSVNASLAFGDGVKTYPAGGIPVSIGNLGCPNTIESFMIYDNGNSGYAWSYDQVNQKLIAKFVPGVAHSHPLALVNAAVVDGATTRVNAGTNLLGANTGSNITVAGGGVNGGVQSATPGNSTLSEPSTVAIAAQTLKVELMGW